MPKRPLDPPSDSDADPDAEPEERDADAPLPRQQRLSESHQLELDVLRDILRRREEADDD